MELPVFGRGRTIANQGKKGVPESGARFPRMVEDNARPAEAAGNRAWREFLVFVRDWSTEILMNQFAHSPRAYVPGRYHKRLMLHAFGLLRSQLWPVRWAMAGVEKLARKFPSRRTLRGGGVRPRADADSAQLLRHQGCRRRRHGSGSVMMPLHPARRK